MILMKAWQAQGLSIELIDKDSVITPRPSASTSKTVSFSTAQYYTRPRLMELYYEQLGVALYAGQPASMHRSINLFGNLCDHDMAEHLKHLPSTQQMPLT